MRYCDDFLLFGNSRAELADAEKQVRSFLSGLRLQCHPRKTCVRPCGQGVRFLGFRLLPQTRRISHESISRFRSRMARFKRDKKFGMADMQRVTASVRGWLQHASHANTHALIREVLADVRI